MESCHAPDDILAAVSIRAQATRAPDKGRVCPAGPVLDRTDGDRMDHEHRSTQISRAPRKRPKVFWTEGPNRNTSYGSGCVFH